MRHIPMPHFLNVAYQYLRIPIHALDQFIVNDPGFDPDNPDDISRQERVKMTKNVIACFFSILSLGASVLSFRDFCKSTTHYDFVGKIPFIGGFVKENIIDSFSVLVSLNSLLCIYAGYHFSIIQLHFILHLYTTLRQKMIEMDFDANEPKIRFMIPREHLGVLEQVRIQEIIRRLPRPQFRSWFEDDNRDLYVSGPRRQFEYLVRHLPRRPILIEDPQQQINQERQDFKGEFEQDPQNVHREEVSSSVVISLQKLSLRYEKSKAKQDAALRDIQAHISAMPAHDRRKEAALRCINRIRQSTISQPFNLTFLEAITLVWQGILDKNAPPLELKEVNDQYIRVRKDALIDKLVEIDNSNDPVCPGGTITRLVASLNRAHTDVIIYLGKMESESVVTDASESVIFLVADVLRKEPFREQRRILSSWYSEDENSPAKNYLRSRKLTQVIDRKLLDIYGQGPHFTPEQRRQIINALTDLNRPVVHRQLQDVIAKIEAFPEDKDSPLRQKGIEFLKRQIFKESQLSFDEEARLLNENLSALDNYYLFLWTIRDKLSKKPLDEQMLILRTWNNDDENSAATLFRKSLAIEFSHPNFEKMINLLYRAANPEIPIQNLSIRERINQTLFGTVSQIQLNNTVNVIKNLKIHEFHPMLFDLRQQIDAIPRDENVNSARNLAINRLKENAKKSNDPESLVVSLRSFKDFDAYCRRILEIERRYVGNSPIRQATFKDIRERVDAAYTEFSNGKMIRNCGINLARSVKSTRDHASAYYNSQSFLATFRASGLVAEIDAALESSRSFAI